MARIKDFHDRIYIEFVTDTEITQYLWFSIYLSLYLLSGNIVLPSV